MFRAGSTTSGYLGQDSPVGGERNGDVFYRCAQFSQHAQGLEHCVPCVGGYALILHLLRNYADAKTLDVGVQPSPEIGNGFDANE